METSFPLPVRFTCLDECGMCCSYRVKLKDKEKKTIGERVKFPFLREGEYLLKKDGFCIFLDRDKRCHIYPYRPEQCVNYPFYPEEGQIDVDLSCPGVGKGEEVSREYLLSLIPDSALPNFSFPVPELKNIPNSPAYLPDTLRNLLEETLSFKEGKGTHLRRGKVEVYSFSLDKNTIKVENTPYPYPSVHIEKFGELVKEYLGIWIRRKIFLRAVSIASFLWGKEKENLSRCFLSFFGEKVTLLGDFFLRYWKGISYEEAVREAIRAVDGRWRDKLSRFRVETRGGAR